MLARRTQQFCGNTGEASDVSVDGLALHVECKRTERVRMSDWLEQVQRDAKGRPWGIFHRQSRQPWLVIMLFDEWVKDSKAAQAAILHRKQAIDRAAEEAWNVE